MTKFLDSEGLARLWENVKAYINSHTGGGGGIPSGCILIWSGAADAVPSGWALCDGNNGAPDLRDRFVLGAGTDYMVGAKGGEATHKLTVTEMPSHKHQLYNYTSAGYYNSSGYAVSGSKSNFSDGIVGATGGGAAHNNMPPYYALCYIMKL